MEETGRRLPPTDYANGELLKRIRASTQCLLTLFPADILLELDRPKVCPILQVEGNPTLGQMVFFEVRASKASTWRGGLAGDGNIKIWLRTVRVLTWGDCGGTVTRNNSDDSEMENEGREGRATRSAHRSKRGSIQGHT